jgi:hypothetical protein
MIHVTTSEQTGQRRGEDVHKTEILRVDFGAGDQPAFLVASWPFEDFEGAEGADPYGWKVQRQRRFRGVVERARAVAVKRAELEDKGTLTERGVLEAVRPLAHEAIKVILEAGADMTGARGTAERELRALRLPGAESPYAAEIRAALRSMKAADRFAALAELTADEQAAVLDAPAFCSGIDRGRHEVLRERAFAELPGVAELRQRAELAGTVEAKAAEALALVRKVAAIPDPSAPAPGVRPS